MARKRSLDEGPVLRGQIMAVAARLFSERGYGSTSIRDIADQVDISSSTMYHHFGSKQEILQAVLTTFMANFDAALEPVLCDPDVPATERIRRAVRLHIEISDDRRQELVVGTPIRYALTPEQRATVTDLQSRYHRAVEATIVEGMQQGDFAVADTRIATMAVLDMLNGIRQWLRGTGPLTREELIELYVDMVLRLLGASGRPWPVGSAVAPGR